MSWPHVWKNYTRLLQVILHWDTHLPTAIAAIHTQKRPRLSTSCYCKNTRAAVGYAGLLEIYRTEKQIGPLLELLGKAAAQTASLEQIGGRGTRRGCRQTTARPAGKGCPRI